MDNMTTARRELIQQLLKQKATDVRGRGIPPREPGTRVPLTPAQAGIWFFTQLFPDSTEYNCFDVLSVPWSFTRAELSHAVRALVDRHDALRIRIAVEDGDAYQYDQPAVDPDVDWTDLRDVPRPEAERRAEEIANACARTPLPLGSPPLFRVSAVAMPDDEVLVVFLIHHIINDYITMALLMEELSALLAGEPLGPPATAGFLDYAVWLADTADEERVAAELDYWTTRLGGDLPVLDLPKDRPRTSESSRHGHAVALEVPLDLVAGLRQLAARNGTTLFVALLAAYKVFLMRLTAQDDVIVGTALNGRDHPDAENVVGCFIKSVALRTLVPSAASFHDVIRAVHITLAEAQDHQMVSFDRIVDALGAPRWVNNHPVFQTFFGVQSEDELQLHGAKMNPTKLLDYGTAKWDLAVTLWETPQGLDGVLDCSAELFGHETALRFRDIYLQLCRLLMQDPGAGVGTHSLVSSAERDRIIHALNPYERVHIPYATMAELFERQVERTPEAVAVQEGSRLLTYRGLNEWANRIAWTLRGLGAGRGVRVALFMERSLETLVMVYAVAKSGAAYVPLDPGLPDARLAFMLEDTAPDIVIAEESRTGQIPSGAWNVLTFADVDVRSADEPTDNLPTEGAGYNVSHLLYTSGSTGRPKAVVCPVQTAVADILEMQRRLSYEPSEVVLFKTSYGFDTSLWEIFWPLYVGARVVVCPPDADKDPARLVELIERHQVTAVDLTPTLLQAVVDHMEEPGRCASLRYMHTGGEAVTAALRDDFHAKFAAVGTELINGYGPTETACMVTTRLPPAPSEPVVPLGRPHRHFRLYVLDEELNVVPVNVPGEAYLSSEVGITYGYHRRPDLTAERFLPDPYGPPGSRMYRTGDLCRYRPDGTVDFLGRVDTQVKIRGNRIELAEVETVLRQHPDVAECAVVTVGEGGDRALAAFVRMRPGTECDARALLDHTASALPRAMVPSGVQAIERIPVNVNGKTDRRALQRAWRGTVLPYGGARVAPANDVERRLARVYREALGLQEVGVTDSFFDLGGHSLKIFKVIAACEKQLGFQLQVADVFAAPTVRLLAERIGSTRPVAQSGLVALQPLPGRPLVVFIHATSGSALPFRDVARSLGEDFSAYALQTPDVLTDHAGHTIEDLAARYVGAVDGVRGLSPVFLVGWSMGGCVALEMARMWRAQGAGVTGTVMLDTWLPPRGLSASAFGSAELHAAFPEVDVLAMEGLDVALGAEAPEELERLRRVIELNSAAYLEYAPKPFDGEVHLLRARETPDAAGPGTPVDLGHDYGWGAVVRSVVTRDIAGTHYTLLAEENAPDLAATIREIAEGGGFHYGEV
jgi:amino acid adenylation domain-containing protein